MGSGKKTSKAKKLKTRVTHLEMTNRQFRNTPIPTRPIIALMRAQNLPAHFYQYLYQMVGKRYHWEARRSLDEKALLEIINGEDCEIHVLYADGCPAGFFELSTADFPQSVEIVYFGLGVEHQGLGLGKWFASAAINAAWEHNPEKVTVETCTLDHPAALPLYQKLGFTPIAISEAEIEPWM